MLKNTYDAYGLIAKIVHWLAAILTVSLFALGLWMVQLDYYHDWYTKAPHYHVSFGVLLATIFLFRFIWRLYNITPLPPANHSALIKKLAHWTHFFIYFLLFTIVVSGYLIPTADNRDIDVFNWFTLPSLGSLFENQEDIAGQVHLWLAYTLIAVAVIHALSALKHHFIDKDNTLKRML